MDAYGVRIDLMLKCNNEQHNESFKTLLFIPLTLYLLQKGLQKQWFSAVMGAEDREERAMAKHTKYVANYQNIMFLCIEQLFSGSNAVLSCYYSRWKSL